MSAPMRRERIEAMLIDEPLDAFLRYGLAMEWDKEGDCDRSLALLSELTRHSTMCRPSSAWGKSVSGSTESTQLARPCD